MMDERRIQNGLQMLRWIEQQGVVFYAGKMERETAKKYLRKVPVVFPELVAKLCAIYLFRQSEQTGDCRGYDGVCWWRETPGGIQYAVGLAVEAMEQGKTYSIELFIHELAHLTNGPHDERAFYCYLDEMAAQYRKRTGEPVFPDHHDLEPDVPPGGPGRPRKVAYRGPDEHSAEAARRRMIERQRRTARENV